MNANESRKTLFPEFTPEEETDVMRRIALGDHAAYGRVADMYMTDIYRFSLGVLRNPSTAEDVTQETFTRLWNKAEQWKPTGRLRSWLLRIAHNLCADHLKSRKDHVDLDKSAPFLPASAEYDPRISYLNNQISDIVQKSLHDLGDRQQTAVVLTYYLDCSNAQAAEIMDMGVDAFESLLSRARTTLKSKLKNYKHLIVE